MSLLRSRLIVVAGVLSLLTGGSPRCRGAGWAWVLPRVPPWSPLTRGVLSRVPGGRVGLWVRLLCRWVPCLVRCRIPLRGLWLRAAGRSCGRGRVVTRGVGLSSSRGSYCCLRVSVLGVGGGLGGGSVSVGLVREARLGRGAGRLGGGRRSVAALLVRSGRVIVRVVVRSCVAVVGRCVLYWWLPSWVAGLVSVTSLLQFYRLSLLQFLLSKKLEYMEQKYMQINKNNTDSIFYN